jgi:glycosyltransferase involved in cell wall biosynthesis
LTVAYTDAKFKGNEYSFKTLYLPVNRIGPISIHTHNLYRIAKNYDVVIGLSDIRWVRLMLLGFFSKRKYKLILWGIGVRASYENSFDAKTKMDIIRFFFTKRADALIFYSSYPIKKYLEKGFSESKLFVANNTVDAPFNTKKTFIRNQLLFIGTLYKAKGMEVLLDAYKELQAEHKEIFPLKIVGGGENFENIQSWVAENKLNDTIELLGPVYDKGKLEEIFRTSVACVSPNQAGLSVLSSMAYGCTFITKKDAITGGEVFNITDGETGMFYDGTKEDLKKTMLFACTDKEKMDAMSKNAFKHYREHRTPQQMANAIIDAVEFSLAKN